MTRIRTSPTVINGDGGAFHRGHRPPDKLIPKPFIAAFNEHDRISERLRDINDEHGSMALNWGTLTHEAMKSDARAATTAARTGDAISPAQPALEELNRRRAELQATQAALNEARNEVENELADIRSSEQGNLNAYRIAEEKARTALAKALEPLEEAMERLTEAVALREWIELHYPWDTNTAFDVREIWEPASRYNDPQYAVRVTNIINAIKSL